VLSIEHEDSSLDPIEGIRKSVDLLNRATGLRNIPRRGFEGLMVVLEG
jgi:hypothetical protein